MRTRPARQAAIAGLGSAGAGSTGAGVRSTGVTMPEVVAGQPEGDTIRRVTGASIDLAVLAGLRALDASDVAAAAIGCVLVATDSDPGRPAAAAPEIADRLGATHAGAFDLTAAGGFCYGLAVAGDLVRAGTATHVLVIGVGATNRPDALVAGAEAGAAVVGPAATSGIGPVVWSGLVASLPATRPSSREELRPGLGSPSGAQRQSRYATAWGGRSPAPLPVRDMSSRSAAAITDVGRRALAAAGVSAHDLAALVPDRANDRIIDGLARGLGLPDRVAVARAGHARPDGREGSGAIRRAGGRPATDRGGASIPVALTRLLVTGEARPRGLALLLGLGAGSSSVGQVIRLPGPGRTRPAGPALSPDEAIGHVREAIRALGGPAAPGLEVRSASRFTGELGGDNLFAAEVAGEVEQRLGLSLANAAIHRLATVGELVAEMVRVTGCGTGGRA